MERMDRNSVERAAFVVGGSLLLMLVYKTYCVLRSPTSRVPGPWLSKWTGAVLTYHWLRGRRCQYIHRLHQQYGPTVRVAPNEVDVTDAESIKTVYANKELFRKTNWYVDFTTKGVETLFNTLDVDFHRRHRRLLAGPISEASLRAYNERIADRTQLAVAKMRDEMVSRGATDVMQWFYFLATDVIGDLTFGQSFGMLELGRKNEYSQHLEEWMWMSAIRVTFPTLTALAMRLPLQLPWLSQAQEATRRQTRYAAESLARYRQLAESAAAAPQTLFSNLFRAHDADKLSPAEIRNEAEVYILAGSDTTAKTLTYLVWAVCRRPRVQAALLGELRTLPGDFDASHLRGLPYLDCVVHEALRLYTAAPSGLPRRVPAGGAELGGYRLAEGTTVCAQAWTVHRDPAVFPAPETFDPSRWEAPSKAMRDAFMPFGRGPRICIGQHLAMVELRFATARFFLAFPDARVSTLEGMSDDDMAEEIYFVLAPEGKRCLIEAPSVTGK